MRNKEEQECEQRMRYSKPTTNKEEKTTGGTMKTRKRQEAREKEAGIKMEEETRTRDYRGEKKGKGKVQKRRRQEARNRVKKKDNERQEYKSGRREQESKRIAGMTRKSTGEETQ